jgi:hypothetical protein
MKHITEDCEITVADGEISVDYRHEREVTITSNEGVERRPASSVFPGLSSNWWTANWSGSDWNLDLDCGCQRFNGVTTTKRIKEALATAGLETAEIKAVVSLAKKKRHFSVGRHG